jgi:hypothetical protein
MLGGAALPCSLGGGAAVATVNGSGLDKRKFITYALTGTPANTYNSVNQAIDLSGWFCYEAPTEFTAYSNNGSTTFPHTSASFSQLGNAPQLANGDYVGLLASCTDLDSLDPSPCVSSYQSGVNEDSGVPYETIEISTPPGDPHMGG